MNGKARIRRCFELPEKILSIYLPAGFPGRGDTLPLARAAVAGGAAMLEIGFPFSDPIADGPVIQRSNIAAIANGVTLRFVLSELPALRAALSVPLILMGALNPILQYGDECFFRDAAAAGADGLIVPDLPFEEYRRSYQAVCEAAGLAFIPLFTTRTSEKRLRHLDAESDGFLYLVSSEGTTGGQLNVDSQRQAEFERVARLGLQNPIMVGFGISDAVGFKAATRHARGGIVGSAFIEAIATGANPAAAAQDFVERLRR